MATADRDPVLDDILSRRGAVTRIATALGISTAAVSQWRQVPLDRVEEVAKVLGLSPASVRPDAYPPGSSEAA